MHLLNMMREAMSKIVGIPGVGDVVEVVASVAVVGEGMTVLRWITVAAVGEGTTVL